MDDIHPMTLTGSVDEGRTASKFQTELKGYSAHATKIPQMSSGLESTVFRVQNWVPWVWNTICTPQISVLKYWANTFNHWIYCNPGCRNNNFRCGNGRLQAPTRVPFALAHLCGACDLKISESAHQRDTWKAAATPNLLSVTPNIDQVG